MPYIEDINKNKKYIPSKYAKEELPTWNEIYNEFYKEKVYYYDQNNESHQEVDLYWRLPHRKMLLGWICNQLNKMLFEDGMKDDILESININYNKVEDIHFILDSSDNDDNDKSMIYHELPIIYTCNIPSTGKRSIFASSLPSINIKDINGCITLRMILRIGIDDYMILPLSSNEVMFWNIISEILIGMITYFTGELVGWKDSDGNIISDVNGFKPGCGYDVGIDAAL